MFFLCVAKIRLCVKSYHSYNYKYTIGTELEYLQKPENQHSESAVLVCLKKINKRMKVVGNIPKASAKIFHGLMSAKN